MRLRTLAILLPLAAAVPAVANEFGDHCANGLANYEVLVATDCSVNWTDPKTGKTYCFSSENSKEEFLEDSQSNIEKAEKSFAELGEQ